MCLKSDLSVDEIIAELNRLKLGDTASLDWYPSKPLFDYAIWFVQEHRFIFDECRYVEIVYDTIEISKIIETKDTKSILCYVFEKIGRVQQRFTQTSTVVTSTYFNISPA